MSDRVESIKYRNVMSFKVSDTLRQEIINMAGRYCMTTSDFIRNAIRLYIYVLRHAELSKDGNTVTVEVPKKLLGSIEDMRNVRKHVIVLD